jgi:hypothetical protein
MVSDTKTDLCSLYQLREQTSGPRSWLELGTSPRQAAGLMDL